MKNAIKAITIKKMTVLTLAIFFVGILFSNVGVVNAATAGKYIKSINESYVDSLGILSLKITADNSVGSIQAIVNDDTKKPYDISYKSSNTYERGISGIKANNKIVLTAYDLDGKKLETLTFVLNASGKLVTSTTTKVAVTSVTLNKKSLDLTAGDKTSLSATIAPSNATNKNVTWKSDNTKIATVDNNGAVTAVAAGKANIIVTTADGNKVASCAITVKAKEVPVNDIMLTIPLKVNATMSFGVLVNPSNATDKTVVWSSSAPSIVSVDAKGNAKALKAGTAVLTAKTKDGKKSTSIAINVTK